MKTKWATPPGWPEPPYPQWAPPPGWQPDPAWPPPPAGWQFWQPVPSPTVSRRIRSEALLIVAGSLAAMVGAFGTWITIKIGVGGKLPGTGGFDSGRDGPFVFLLALVTLGAAAPRVVGSWVGRWLDVVAVIAAAVLMLVCIADTADVHHRVVRLQAVEPYVGGGVGAGLKLALVASIVIFAAAAASFAETMWQRHRSADSGTPSRIA